MTTSDRRLRVVVGATGDDAAARRLARALLMEGREVVFLGGGQQVEQVVRAAEAEDAGEVVLDAASDDLDRVRDLLRDIGLEQVEVSRCDQPDAPGPPRSG